MPADAPTYLVESQRANGAWLSGTRRTSLDHAVTLAMATVVCRNPRTTISVRLCCPDGATWTWAPPPEEQSGGEVSDE